MMTLKQYQRILTILDNDNLDDYHKKLSCVAIISGMSFEEVLKLKQDHVNHIFDKVTQVHEQVKTAPIKNHITIGNSTFKMVHDFNECTAGQLIEVLNYDLNDFANINRNMQNILATLSFKCLFLKWYPESYNANDHKWRAEQFLNANIVDVMGYIGFFLGFSEILHKSLKDVLQREMRNRTTDRE